MNAELNPNNRVTIDDSTVEFYNFDLNGIDTLYFDTSKSGPPHPMLNAMAGLKVLKDKQQLIMVNHHSPDGLFPKIEANFNYEVSEIEDGNVKVVFTKKLGTTPQTDFNDNQCSGGCA